jgi:carboxypeptidase T
MAALSALILFLSRQAPDDTPNGEYRGLYTWPQIEDRIGQLEKGHPELLRRSSLGKTAEGREIPILRLSSPGEDTRPEILLMAGIHPREQQPQICLLRLLADLVEGYGHDDRITRLVRERTIWFLPVLNVDGKVYDMKYGNGKDKGANWRKNRRRNGDGSFGVDLNRNFPIRWGSGTEEGKSETYEGPHPLSEPETHALERFFEERPLRVFVDLHSTMKAILHPGFLTGSDHDRFEKLASGCRSLQKDPYAVTKAAKDEDPPLVRGGNTGLTNAWAYYTHGVYSLIFEISGKGFYDAPGDVLREYDSNVREPLLYLIGACGDLPLPKKGEVSLVRGSYDGRTVPGAHLSWTPVVEGTGAFGVLATSDAAVEVTSEVRFFPLKSGFTLQISSKAKPSTAVPMTLYLWDQDRGRSVERFTLTVSPP